jgi:hypothetical protein
MTKLPLTLVVLRVLITLRASLHTIQVVADMDTSKQAIPTVQTVPYISSDLVCSQTQDLEQRHHPQRIAQHPATVPARYTCYN